MDDLYSTSQPKENEKYHIYILEDFDEYTTLQEKIFFAQKKQIFFFLKNLKDIV